MGFSDWDLLRPTMDTEADCARIAASIQKNRVRTICLWLIVAIALVAFGSIKILGVWLIG